MLTPNFPISEYDTRSGISNIVGITKRNQARYAFIKALLEIHKLKKLCTYHLEADLVLIPVQRRKIVY